MRRGLEEIRPLLQQGFKCLDGLAAHHDGGPAESDSALIDRAGSDICKTLVSCISEHFH